MESTKKVQLNDENVLDEYKTEDTLKNSCPDQKPPKDKKIPKVWNHVKKDYKLQKKLGSGSYGQVIRAVHLPSQRTVAIKLIENIFKDDYEAKKMIREIQIMRKLSQFKDNQYTIKLFDIITNDQMTHVFIVMEYMQMDLKKVLN